MIKNKTMQKIRLIVSGVFIVLSSMLPNVARAEESGYGLSMSPLNQSIILSAGESYTGSFRVSNPGWSESNFKYEVSVKPFFVDEEYNIYYEKEGAMNQIVDWITLSTDSGILYPNTSDEIFFRIDVPEDAPAGGQYAAINVQSAEGPESESDGEGTGININQKIAMAHILYAEIAGTTIRDGSVEVNAPSFIFDGNISANSIVKNSGNVHGVATYTLQVFPLFSDEEVYTNEEDPDRRTILPGRSFYFESSWQDTPGVGIFKVLYTVEFEGETSQLEKIVIKCPIWLLFIVVFVIMLAIFYFVSRARSRKKQDKR